MNHRLGKMIRKRQQNVKWILRKGLERTIQGNTLLSKGKRKHSRRRGRGRTRFVRRLQKDVGKQIKNEEPAAGRRMKQANGQGKRREQAKMDSEKGFGDCGTKERKTKKKKKKKSGRITGGQ